MMQQRSLAGVPRGCSITGLPDLLLASPPPNLPSSTHWADLDLLAGCQGAVVAALVLESHGAHLRRHDAGVKAEAGAMDLRR